MLTLTGWLLYCTILGFAYSSTLKSELMAPQVLPSIDTLQEVVDSYLPVKMVLYDDQFTEILAKSNNPIHQKLWRKKIVLKDYFGPVQMRHNSSHSKCQSMIVYLMLVG